MDERHEAQDTPVGGDSPYPRHGKQMVRFRRRRRRPFLQRSILIPLEEVVRSVLSVVRGHPIPVVLLSAGALWWFWPTLRPSPAPEALSNRSIPRVITVFVEDPQRTIAAFALRQRQPGSLLILQGRPSSQSDSRAYLEHQGKWPADQRGVLTMTGGCDTVGQLTTLAQWVETLPQPGILTVVTSPAHLPRSLAIARIVMEGKGWTVLGMPVETGDNRPESHWRLVRDQFRAQLWRATGWDGTDDLHCRRVEEAAREGRNLSGDSF